MDHVNLGGEDQLAALGPVTPGIFGDDGRLVCWAQVAPTASE